MQKQSKQFTVMLIALVVLVGVFFGLQKYNEAQSEKEAESAEETTAETLIDVASADVVSLSYVYQGETNSFEKEEDTWYAVGDHSLSIAQSFIKNMVYAVAPLEADEKIENVTDLSQYGLGDSDWTVRFGTESVTYDFEIGAYNEMMNVYYVCMPSETTVYVVSADTITAFEKTAADMIESTEETTEASLE